MTTQNTSIHKPALLILACIAIMSATLCACKSVTTVAATSSTTTGVNLPRLVDLGATKCNACKLLAPILEDLKKTYAGKLDVLFIDVWENPDAATPYNITSIPTQIFFDAQGKELFRHEGFFSKEEILAKWKELGVDLSAPPAPQQNKP